MDQFIKLAINDFKLIFREPSLRVFLVLPIVLFALVVWFIPYLDQTYDVIGPYIPVILLLCVVQVTQTFSFISSMVLIEEKETNVAKTYGVVPVSKPGFLFSRLLFPYLFTVCMNVVLLYVQPYYEIDGMSIVLISLLVALVVPLYVLAINSIVDNRIQGLVYIKVFNIIVLIPVAAFFLPESYRFLFGIFPTHWLFQSLAQLFAGTSYILSLSIGFVFFFCLIGWAAHRFFQRHFE